MEYYFFIHLKKFNIARTVITIFVNTPPPRTCTPGGGGGSSAPKGTPKPTTNFTDKHGSVRTSQFTVVSCNQGYLLQDAFVLN